MILVRRAWLFSAIALFIVLYYLFWHTDSDRPDSYQPIPQGKSGTVHWTKQPERHPVTQYAALPTGPVQPIPRIQHDFKSNSETFDARTTREERRTTVKNAFIHAWSGYKKHAWGKDEVGPLSGSFHSSFGGWGATLVDSLDTLWIMDLRKDFEEAVAETLKIDFTTNMAQTLNVFETTIRYLGGLLAAYDLSGKRSLLDKAQELGDILYSAFDNSLRMPTCRWEWQKTALGGSTEPAEWTLLAELGSMDVEFTRLSQLTGDNKYFDAVQRISEVLHKNQENTLIPGLWPTIINAQTMNFSYNHFTFGGMADSTYEYLPKQYVMLGGRDEQYKTMYETAIDTAKRALLFKPLVPNNEDILYSGNAAIYDKTGELILDPQGQHLTCFLGGMLAIGSKIFDRPSDMDVARRVTHGCVWAYNAVPSGLMPETFHLIPCHLGVGEVEPGKCEYSDEKWYEGVAARQHGKIPGQEMSVVERGKYFVRNKYLLPGFTDHGDNRYILRPEAIESVFIMYRITGDSKYQDIAWKMFQSIDKATRTEIAHAAIHDVRMMTLQKSDRMESFWLAETLKYFYLIFSEPDLINLDQWVLNTEAHPFKRPV